MKKNQKNISSPTHSTPELKNIDLYNDPKKSIELLLENKNTQNLDEILFSLGQDYKGLMNWVRQLPTISEPTEVQYRRTLELLAGQRTMNTNHPLKEQDWTYPNNYPSFFDSASLAQAIEYFDMSQIRTKYILVLTRHLVEFVNSYVGLLVELHHYTNLQVIHSRLEGVKKTVTEKMPTVAQETRTYSWLTLAEIEQLFTKPDPSTVQGLRLLAILWLLAGCMLGRNEAANAKFEDVRKSGNECRLKIHGKGAKDRSVRITPRFMQVIEELQGRCGGTYILKRFTRGRDESGAQKWKEPISGHSINTLVGELTPMLSARSALSNGIFKLHAHDLRRSGARALYDAGWAINQISEMLGHSTPTITEKFIGLKLDEATRTIDPFV